MRQVDNMHPSFQAWKRLDAVRETSQSIREQCRRMLRDSQQCRLNSLRVKCELMETKACLEHLRATIANPELTSH
jgi:hypothetical protein